MCDVIELVGYSTLHYYIFYRDLSYNMIDEIESYSFNSSTALQKM